MKSIHHFFSEINCHFQCYNMGRLIHPIDQEAFIRFENNQAPCYSPFLQQAWLAIIFWQALPSIQGLPFIKAKHSEQDYYIWFLKFPLDEQAQLNLVARDYFLRSLLSALGHKKRSISEKLHSLEHVLKDNPYGFEPTEEQRANFHAIVHKEFSLEASSYYPKTQEYLADIHHLHHWQSLGLQGIADMSARLDEENNKALILHALANLPLPPFQAFALCLENHVISKALTQAIDSQLLSVLQSLEAGNIQPKEFTQWCIASIRASAQSEDRALHQQLLLTILKSELAQDIELLATLATRCWKLLREQALLSLFLEALANTQAINQEQALAFNTILYDLMFIPGMREPILKEFRSPQRSQQLTQAIGHFFNQATFKSHASSYNNEPL